MAKERLSMQEFATIACLVTACDRTDLVEELLVRDNTELQRIFAANTDKLDVTGLLNEVYEINKEEPVHGPLTEWPVGFKVQAIKWPKVDPVYPGEIIIRKGQMLIPWLFPFMDKREIGEGRERDSQDDLMKAVLKKNMRTLLKRKVNRIIGNSRYKHQVNDMPSNSVFFVLGEFRKHYDRFSPTQKAAFKKNPREFLYGFACNVKWDEALMPVREEHFVLPEDMTIVLDPDDQKIWIDVFKWDLIIGTKQIIAVHVHCYPCEC